MLDFDETTRWIDEEPRIHYHESGSGAPLVLLHGSGPGVSGWSNFRGNFPVFAEQFRTVIMDMPGFGLSERPVLDKAYPKVAADATLRVLDALGIERANLLGNSMGGYVALEFALAHPDRTDRLVLMGPGGLAASSFGPDPSEGARRLFEFMQAPSKAGMEAWVDTMVANKAILDDQLIDERMANAQRPGAMESAMAIFASLGQFPEEVPMFAKVHKITHPTLVTWGRDDRMLPYEQSVFGYRRMPNAELHVFSGCGHRAQVERKSDFERVVTEFLTRKAESHTGAGS
jgi:4,5:9,10-diseco-3-hydroxy-5,9,17-trioxoandrosta-1(10),2-diene-4-oate hydrolase